MSITRRELFRGLPILGLPALMLPSVERLEAASQDISLPSAGFAFDQLPVHSPNNDQVRPASSPGDEGQSGHRRAYRSTRDDAADRGHASRGASSCALGGWQNFGT
jgi:hypothetical protein